MKLIELAATGVKVSELCLGTMNFGARCDQQGSGEIVHTALDLGVTFFDTAPMYSNGASEEYLGKALGSKRKDVFIATKVHKGVDRKAILESLDESLKRLQTEYIDLYMIHWPAQGMDVIEIMSALNEVVKSGKARFVGCSNYPAWLVAFSNAVAERNGWPRLVCNSVAYNLIERGVEVEILPQAVAEKIAINPYRVLSVGLLTGKYSSTTPIQLDLRGNSDSRVITWLSQYGESVDRFNQFSKSAGISPANLAIAWVRYSKAITSPIIGISSAHQLTETVKGFDFDLTPDQYDQVTCLFDTEVWEEGIQLFPGFKYNFPRLRRKLDLLQKLF
jgi:1-deoxyxylulose-5-phosphate synthase